jgi:gliding motility-associated-like protein
MTVDAVTGCDYIDSVLVEVGQPFALEVPDDIVICYPQDIMLSAVPSVTGLYNFSWTPNATMEGSFSFNPTVDVQATQTYTVEATSEYGCTAQESIDVTLGSLFSLDLSVSNDSLCYGESVSMSAVLSGQADGVVFTWSGDGSISNPTATDIVLSPQQDAVITCLATQASSGCEAQESVTIDVTPVFTVNVTPDLVQTCEAGGTPVSATATLNEPLQWQWSPQEWVMDASSASTQLSTENSGTLSVTATSSAGCEAFASIIIEVSPLITDLGPDIGLCIDQSQTLNVNWPANYEVVWSTGETSSSILVTETGFYSVLVEAPDGCTSQDEVLVEFFDYPELDLGSDTAVCTGEEVRLQAGDPGLSYLWNTGQLSREIYVTEPGVYDVQITNGYCVSMDTIELSFNPLPVQPFLPEYTFCFEASTESFFLDAKNPGSSYVWSNDSLGARLFVNEPGDYSVLVVTEHGCALEFSTHIEQECIEALFIPNSFTPDGDGINDSWFVYGVNIVNYHLQLYNRMGEMFYESYDMSKPWLGQRRDGTQYVDSEVYPYIIRYQLVEEDGVLSTEQVVKGFVTLIR